MSLIHGFAPLARPDARLLILGSMPGQRSLLAQEYYAHPQNAFWRIMGTLLGFDARAPYSERWAALLAARVALWDVLASCARPSSLDADIVEASIRPSDLAGFLAGHPHIGAIHFNGAKAAAVFTRHLLDDLPATVQALPRQRLPSTSAAHAGLGFEAKLAIWRQALSRTAEP